MDRNLGLLAATGFVLAMIVHGLTFLPSGSPITSHNPIFWLLHIGVFVVFVPMVIHLTRNSQNLNIITIFRIFPLWAIALIFATVAYAYINFASFFELTKAGKAEIRNGQYVLTSKGEIVRALTRQEYDVMQGYLARGFSGHWMLFYLLPALYFLFRLMRPRRPSVPNMPQAGRHSGSSGPNE